METLLGYVELMKSFLAKLLPSIFPTGEPIETLPKAVELSTKTRHPLLGHPHLNNAAYWDPKAPAPRMVIFSGAGLSHESGLSLYRGDEGLWEGHKIDEVCNANTWRLFRAQVESFYEARRQEDIQAQPHAGHAWCVEQEKQGAVLITQNVDTLLERAGAQHVGHLHGRLDHRKCFACEASWEVSREISRVDMTCPQCQSEDTRSDIVLFGEKAQAYEGAMRVIGGLTDNDVLVITGTSGQVINPLRWLTQEPQVWVVDPNEATFYKNYAKLSVWKAPASQLEETVGVAWRTLKRRIADPLPGKKLSLGGYESMSTGAKERPGADL